MNSETGYATQASRIAQNNISQADLQRMAGQAAPSASKPLERITDAADRLVGEAMAVEAFLDRVYGAQPTATDANSGQAIVAFSYANEIERLAATVGRLHNAVARLLEVG